MANPKSAEQMSSAKHPTSLRQGFREDLRAYWPMWLLIAVAILLRIYEIQRLPGMHGDEAWYGLQARRLLAGEAVEWRTPTGNVPGMLHLGSLTLLHSIFPPSLFLLRLPSLISSLAAVALAYALGRRFFGPAAAVSAAVLMACLPINIAYARLGWDPSHSPLLILASVYAAMAGRKLLCALFFAFALTNHPSAVFAAPFVTLGFLGFGVAERGWRRSAIETGQLVALLLLGVLLGIALSPATTHYVSASGAISRLFDPEGWARFALMFCRLLSGDTTYAYSVGQGFGSFRAFTDWAVGAGLVIIVIAAIIRFRRRADWKMAGVSAGCIASLALLYLAAGSWVLEPRLERFSYPMVPIAALTIAVILNSILPAKRWLQRLLVLVAVPMLAGFWLHYVVPLKDGKSRQALGFWTASQDPARSVFDRISADAAASAGGRIIVEDWWLHMPISYYAAGQPFDVIDARKLDQRNGPLRAANTYWVSFGGSELDKALASRNDVRLRDTIPTSNRDSNIRIWHSAER